MMRDSNHCPNCHAWVQCGCSEKQMLGAIFKEIVSLEEKLSPFIKGLQTRNTQWHGNGRGQLLSSTEAKDDGLPEN